MTKFCGHRKEEVKKCLFGLLLEKREALYEGDPHKILVEKNVFEIDEKKSYNSIDASIDAYVDAFKKESARTRNRSTFSVFFMLEVRRRPLLWKLIPNLFYRAYSETYEAETESQIQRVVDEFRRPPSGAPASKPRFDDPSMPWKTWRAYLLVARAMKKVILECYYQWQSKKMPDTRFKEMPDMKFDPKTQCMELIFL